MVSFANRLFFVACFILLFGCSQKYGDNQKSSKKAHLNNPKKQKITKKAIKKSNWPSEHTKKEMLAMSKVLLKKKPLEKKPNDYDELKKKKAELEKKMELVKMLLKQSKKGRKDSVGTDEDYRKVILNAFKEIRMREKKSLERFEYWKKRLQSSDLKAREREKAIAEISKMDKDTIFPKLLKILKEGTTYFLTNKEGAPKLDGYYDTIVIILGQLEHLKAAKPLFEAFQTITEKLLLFPAQDSLSTKKEKYAQTLVKALFNLKGHHYVEQVKSLSQQIGNDFWLKVKADYEKRIQEK